MNFAYFQIWDGGHGWETTPPPPYGFSAAPPPPPPSPPMASKSLAPIVVGGWGGVEMLLDVCGYLF
jgi:hypothetical protein